MSVLDSSITEIRRMTRSSITAAHVGIAVHEAGHAIGALAMGRQVSELVIIDDGGEQMRGYCEWDTNGGNSTADIVGIISGLIAPRFLRTDVCTDPDVWVLSQKDDLDGLQAYTSEEIATATRLAMKYLDDNRSQLAALVLALLNQEMLGERDITRLTSGLVTYNPPSRSITASRPNTNTMSRAQRNRIADALEKLLDAQRERTHVAPVYRIGDRRIETRVGLAFETRGVA